MKIGIDARLYGTRHGGIGRYIENLLKQLESIDHTNQYYVFLQKSNFDSYQPKNNNFTKILADFKAYSFGEQLIFPKILNKYHLDLVHFTHFNAPVLYRGKFIITIHDLIISHYPSSRATTLHPVIYKIKLFFYNLVINQLASRAKKIITVSEYSKKDIVKLLPVKATKVAVTYEGVGIPVKSNAICNNVKSRLGISNDFILYVGSAYPHKNLEKLISAFNQIIKINSGLQLVLVGDKNYFYNQLAIIIKEKGLQDSVKLTGYLEDNDLACLYQEAKLYVFPSLIEGFGLPPLEAQSYGLPVLSSFNSCLPEILGDSALYFNPNNSKELAELVMDTLNNDDVTLRLKSRGFDNVKKYSWEKCANQTLAEYQK